MNRYSGMVLGVFIMMAVFGCGKKEQEPQQENPLPEIKGIAISSDDVMGPWVEAEKDDKGGYILGNERLDLNKDGTFSWIFYMQKIGTPVNPEKEIKLGDTQITGLGQEGTYTVTDNAVKAVQTLDNSSEATPTEMRFIMEKAGVLCKVSEGKITARFYRAVLVQ